MQNEKCKMQVCTKVVFPLAFAFLFLYRVVSCFSL